MVNSNEKFMRLAARLAKKGEGRTSPNPMVGAVVVKNGKIVGRGYHKKAGGPHAEIAAFKQAGTKLTKNSDLYVTLEPCAHQGKTPPCTEAVIKAGVKRVFIGAKDPNPLVSGRGIRELKKAGIEVVSGVLTNDCRDINRAYNKYITTGLPYVILKLATTLDGRIAIKTGESKWITSPEARRYVHELRNKIDCVMVGMGTVLKDDPMLTVRGIKGGRNPARAVVGGKLKISPNAKIFKSTGEEVFIFAGRSAGDAAELPGTIKKIRETKGGVSLKAVLKELGKRGITSVMVEGGARLATSMLREGLTDRIMWFVAPTIFGGDGMPSIGELNLSSVAKAYKLKNISTKVIGPDILIEGEL